ncbi:CesT family type III secretion system chaperone [Noviherbaspirillum pedocola]|uniref:Type III secretion system chaperone n=1 Tax=Noviherbaspirillum pedocola TaxID=2801341 RepID=A0A934SV01_9BURK|nr:CesT family type III secretion system chaperone [Noviherbaspirillum pedocola]MBK4733244.1 type III secretion system chaperone [Noviherbaspirillum pedocola]
MVVKLVHPGLTAYLLKRQSGSPRCERDGTVVLIIDRRFRVQCRPLPGGALLLESRLGEMPMLERERTALTLRLLEALGRAVLERPETIALSSNGNTLVQQRQIASQADGNAFEAVLECHVNALGFWRSLIGVL